ncbi:MAG: C25 family cysteine peptidase [Gemmataceae bacterium]
MATLWTEVELLPQPHLLRPVLDLATTVARPIEAVSPNDLSFGVEQRPAARNDKSSIWIVLRSLLLLTFLCFRPSSLPAAEPAPPPQWIVVTAPALRQTVEPLIQHRRAQGMKVVAVTTTDVLTVDEIRLGQAVQLRDHVRQLCQQHRGTSYLLLVGAVEPNWFDKPEQNVLPPLRGTVGRMKGQPSDNDYGCLDDSLLPSVAVGRFPARTANEAEVMVQKTLFFERDRRPGAWRRRLTILAGVPEFNPVVDKLVETMALARLEKIDPVWTGRAIYHNPQSRFCVPDELLHAKAVQYVQEGQAFTIYLGHSEPGGLYGGRARFLTRDDWGTLKIPQGAGILATFGCLGCQLSGRDGEGYGIAALRNPQGPVAVIGSHGICFAAMVQLAAQEFFDATFSGPLPERLGDCWLQVKRGLAQGTIDPITFRLLDAVDGDSTIPQGTQRREHLQMFLLLGDPALRLPVMSQDVQLTGPEAIQPGATITIDVQLPPRLAGAQVHIQLERPVTSQPPDLEPLPKDAGTERNRIMLANHERANRFTIAERIMVAQDGRCAARFALPQALPWPHLLVRVHAVSNNGQEGMGVRRLPVAKEP